MATTTTTDKQEAKRVWEDYRKSPSQETRNRLMERYLHIVRYNAERIRAKLPDEVERDDLVSAGVFGLMDAIDAYDTERGVKFETYCAPRIRGAILDELRSMDWVPRLVRSKASKIARAGENLEANLCRLPTEEEVCQRLDMTAEEFAKAQRETVAATVVSLSRKCFETDSNRDVREIDVLEDKRSLDSAIETQRRDLREMLTRGLSRAERLILILYYYEEMTMKEIGEVLDLSESRVSQMHSALLTRLKDQLASRSLEETAA